MSRSFERSALTDAAPALGPESMAPGTGPRWWKPWTWGQSGSTARGDFTTEFGAEFGAPRGSSVPLPSPVPLYDGEVYVTEDEMLRVSALWRGVNLIADSLAQVPLSAYDVHTASGDLMDPVTAAHQVGTPSVLFRPEADSPRSQTIQRLIWSIVVWGNAYVLTDNSISADPERVDFIHVLDPRRITVWRDERGYKRFRLQRPDRSIVDFPLGKVLHVPWVTMPGSDVGVGALQAFGDAGIRMSLALTAYLRGALVEGGIPSAVITVDTSNLTDEQATALKSEWMAKMGGRRIPAVVPKNITVAPIQADAMLTTHAKDVYNLACLEVANILGLPVSALGGAIPGSTLDYKNLEAQQRDLVAGIRPFAMRLEEMFGMCVPSNQRAAFQLDALARGETRSRFEGYEIALRSGLLTLEEARSMENLPLPGHGEPGERYPPPPPAYGAANVARYPTGERQLSLVEEESA